MSREDMLKFQAFCQHLDPVDVVNNLADIWELFWGGWTYSQVANYLKSLRR